MRVDFPLLGKEYGVSELSLGSDFYGEISSVVMFNEPITNRLINFYSQRFGIQTHAQLEAMGEGAFLVFCPLRMSNNIIYDPRNRIKGSLNMQSGYIVKHANYQTLSQYCKIQQLLPFFHLLRRFDPTSYPTLLNQLLDLIITLF